MSKRKPAGLEPKKMIRIGDSEYTTFSSVIAFTAEDGTEMITIPENDARRGVSQLNGRKPKPPRRNPAITEKVQQMLRDHPDKSPQWISIELNEKGWEISEDQVYRIKNDSAPNR